MFTFFHDDEGQGLVEYALIIAVIAIAVIVAMLFLRGQLQNIFSNIGNNLTSGDVARRDAAPRRKDDRRLVGAGGRSFRGTNFRGARRAGRCYAAGYRRRRPSTSSQ